MITLKLHWTSCLKHTWGPFYYLLISPQLDGALCLVGKLPSPTWTVYWHAVYPKHFITSISPSLRNSFTVEGHGDGGAFSREGLALMLSSQVSVGGFGESAETIRPPSPNHRLHSLLLVHAKWLDLQQNHNISPGTVCRWLAGCRNGIAGLLAIQWDIQE